MGLNVAIWDVGESEMYPGLSYPMYQAQFKWIKPGWPIRHKLYIPHGSNSPHPTCPHFSQRHLRQAFLPRIDLITKLTVWQYLMKYCRKPNNGHRLRRAIMRKGDITDATKCKANGEVEKGRNPSVDEKPSSRSGEPPLLMLEPEASHWLHMTPTEPSIASLHTQLHHRAALG